MKILGAGDKEFWAKAVRAWERWEPVVLSGLGASDPAMFRALELEPGMWVLDLACGSGDPSLAIAQWLTPGGMVLGIDTSPAMLDVARRRARHLGLRNVRFQRGDLAKLPLRGPRFDRVVSRQGLMFTHDVPGTLRGIRQSLKPSGRAVFVVWGPSKLNPAAAIRREVGMRFGEKSPPDPETIPHPMRFARPGLLPKLLRQHGFTGVIARDVRGSTVLPDLDTFVRFQLEMPLAPLDESLRPADRRRLREVLTRSFRPFQQGEVVRVPSMVWVVTARVDRTAKRG